MCGEVWVYGLRLRFMGSEVYRIQGLSGYRYIGLCGSGWY